LELFFQKKSGDISGLFWELALCLFAVIFFLHPIFGWDLWWQIRAGEWMLANGSVMSFDVFSFTKLGHQWINHEWGSEIVFYLIYNCFGIAGLIFMKCSALMLAVVFLWRCCRRLLKNPAIAAFLVCAAIWVIMTRASVRPHIFSLTFLSLIWYLLTAFREDSPRKNLLYIPLIELLWVNLHGGAFLGVVLFFLVLLGYELDTRFFKRGGGVGKFPWIVFALTVGAMFINPFTWHAFTFPFEHLSMTTIIQMTEEWQSPFSSQWSGLLAVRIWMGLMFLSILMVLRRVRQLGFSYLLCAFFAVVVGMMAVRNLAISIIILLPVACAALGQTVPSICSEDGRFRAKVGVIIYPLIIVSALALAYFGVPRSDGAGEISWVRPAIGVNEKATPAEAVAFLKKNNINGKVFNDLGLGGYLILNDIPVFIDGRTPLYGDDFFKTWYVACRDPRVFHYLSKKYGVDMVMLMADRIDDYRELHKFLIAYPSWKPVYLDGSAVIYVKDIPKFERTPAIDPEGIRSHF
jgi:hypothetical protein